MTNLEEIYDQALEMLRQGYSQEEVLIKFADYKNDLSPLLSLSTELFAMPKNTVPTPLMQRRYASAKVKSWWLTWAHIPKFAGVSMSIMLLLSAFTVVGYQTSKSSPGQALFQVKKFAERSRLILASSQDAKASLQIQIAQKRLNEAQEIFNNPDSNVEQKKAALNELSDQTSTAIAEVNTAAKNNPSSDKNPPLLTSLDSIAHDQQDLLTDIKPDSQIKTAANTALKTLTANTVKISEIKQSVAAAGNEQTLAKLNADPNSVVILGEINKISPQQITVEKTVFIFTSQTVIKNAEGKLVDLKDLNEKSKVNIIGIKNQNNLLAQQILVISPEGQVKDASTENPNAAASKTATGVPASLKKNLEGSQESSSTASSSLPDLNTAVGSVIFEDPSPSK